MYLVCMPVMYITEILVIAVCILVPATFALDLNNLPLTFAAVMISPGDLNDNAGMCPADLAGETTRENISSSVQMLLRPLTEPWPAECGEGPWQRVAYLNMSDPTMECPPSWREYSQDNVRACGRPVTNTGSCESTIYTVNNTQYSKVCGRIIGYQHATPSAFRIGRPIDEPYVEGISVTYGNPRSHIWTFAAGLNDDPNGINACPCASTATTASPSFVGNNYFCESEIDHDNPPSNYFVFFPDDPLWDGQNCPRGNCCEFNSPPFFSVDLDGPTTDDIEVRICADEGTHNEDIPIGLIELYIQ